MEAEERSVPFFDYPYVFVSHEEKFLSIIQDVGRRGAFILQKDLSDFEKRLSKFTGAKNVLGVANCTDGLIIALLAAGISPGEEVIFCSHTFVATAGAIHFTGAIPIPVECGDDHLIDPISVEAAITPKTRAILPTQLNGRTCDMVKLQAIADKHNLFIVEDAAQALGARFMGKATGTFGLASSISFYPAKNLGCLGDGGVVMTSDQEIYERMALLRDHGRNKQGEVVRWGLNSRLDNLQAAILDYKLSHYEKEIKRRREIASLYQKNLEDLETIVLPPGPNSHSDYFDVYQNYEIETEKRDELKVYLKEEKGIGTLVQWNGKAVHHFRELGFDVTLPYTDQIFSRCLMLPMNSSLSNDDITYVCDCIWEFYGRIL